MSDETKPTGAAGERAGKCPVMHAPPANATAGHRSNRDWWPNQVNLGMLHQNPPAGNPLGAGFDYAKAFQTLDLAAVKRDLHALMTDSQAWWPADYGHYGGLFIRMACSRTGPARSATTSS